MTNRPFILDRSALYTPGDTATPKDPSAPGASTPAASGGCCGPTPSAAPKASSCCGPAKPAAKDTPSSGGCC